ncbi:MAG: pilus (MSHA type) biogenesis protein MshL [Campylobacterota bacterium]|nr:pilus (MSHA type) biogenesis protein MshL [Campylobacterota bacterium]
MTPSNFNTFKKISLSLFATLLFSSTLSANCSYQLFSISSAKGISIEEFVDQLSNECDYSIVISDPVANKIIQKNLQKTTLKNLTIDEVLDIVLIQNNLNYTLVNNVLKISYLNTKTYQLDYLIAKRTSSGSTDITLSSQTAASGGLNASGGTTGATAGGASGGGNDSTTGIKIESEEEVKFWHELDLEFEKVLNRPEDDYKVDLPIINKNAGMVTVTATLKQHERLRKYIDHLQNKMQKQVLIDVQMLLVTFNDSKTTGVDWAQLYALQNFKISGTYSENGGGGGIISDTATAVSGVGITLSADASLKEVIKFLKSQGDVHTVSNPKILTLNNQPALITVGTEYFYKIQQSSNQQGSGGGVAATVQNDIVSSVFAGVLLDITPEISNDRTITLKINPSVSRTREDLSTNEEGGRTIPPDLDRRQLASVVTVKDGARIILGGLINKNNSMKRSKVPLLGDIPGLGYLFKYEEEIVSTEELIVIIEPHIIDKTMSKLSLSQLGYDRIDPSIARKKQNLEDVNTTH